MLAGAAACQGSRGKPHVQLPHTAAGRSGSPPAVGQSISPSPQGPPRGAAHSLAGGFPHSSRIREQESVLRTEATAILLPPLGSDTHHSCHIPPTRSESLEVVHKEWGVTQGHGDLEMGITGGPAPRTPSDCTYRPVFPLLPPSLSISS